MLIMECVCECLYNLPILSIILLGLTSFSPQAPKPNWNKWSRYILSLCFKSPSCCSCTTLSVFLTLCASMAFHLSPAFDSALLKSVAHTTPCFQTSLMIPRGYYTHILCWLCFHKLLVHCGSLVYSYRFHKYFSEPSQRSEEWAKTWLNTCSPAFCPSTLLTHLDV